MGLHTNLLPCSGCINLGSRILGSAGAGGPGMHRCGGATPIIPEGRFGRPGETARSPLRDAEANAHPLSDAEAHNLA